MVRDPSTRQVPPRAALRADARLLAQVRAAADVAIERADLGGAPRARLSPPGRHGQGRSCSTISAKACSRPTSTTRRSIRSIATCSRTTASSRCRVASAIPIAKAKSKPASATRRRRRCKGLRFETLEAAQAYLDRWETHWADTRIHGTTKRQVAAMFAEERPALGPLPLEPFRYYRFGERTVHLDGCVEVEAAYYGAPPGWIGQRVQVQWNDLHVRLLAPTDRPAAARASARAARLASHPRRRPAGAHAGLDRRLARRAPPPPAPHIGTVCHAHPRSTSGAHGVRQILGVLALAKKHGAAVVEDAAKAAIEIGVPDLSLPPQVRRAPPARAADAYAKSIRSSASSPSTAISSIARQETRHESRRTRSRAPQTPPLGHGRRPGSAAAARPDRAARAARSRRHARQRRTAAPARPAL